MTVFRFSLNDKDQNRKIEAKTGKMICKFIKILLASVVNFNIFFRGEVELRPLPSLYPAAPVNV